MDQKARSDSPDHCTSYIRYVQNCGFGVAKGNNADHVNQNCVESRFDGNEQVKSGS